MMATSGNGTAGAGATVETPRNLLKGYLTQLSVVMQGSDYSSCEELVGNIDKAAEAFFLSANQAAETGNKKQVMKLTMQMNSNKTQLRKVMGQYISGGDFPLEELRKHCAALTSGIQQVQSLLPNLQPTSPPPMEGRQRTFSALSISPVISTSSSSPIAIPTAAAGNGFSQQSGVAPPTTSGGTVRLLNRALSKYAGLIAHDYSVPDLNLEMFESYLDIVQRGAKQVLYALEDRDMELCRLQVNAILEPLKEMLQEIGDMDKSGLERLIKDMLDAGANDIKKHADKLDFTCKQACAAIPLPDAEQDFRSQTLALVVFMKDFIKFFTNQVVVAVITSRATGAGGLPSSFPPENYNQNNGAPSLNSPSGSNNHADNGDNFSDGLIRERGSSEPTQRSRTGSTSSNTDSDKADTPTHSTFPPSFLSADDLDRAAAEPVTPRDLSNGSASASTKQRNRLSSFGSMMSLAAKSTRTSAKNIAYESPVVAKPSQKTTTTTTRGTRAASVSESSEQKQLRQLIEELEVTYLTPPDVTFKDEGKNVLVKSGSFEGLVELLTAHSYADVSFMGSFLMTYRSFTTSHALLDALVSRFDIRIPDALENDPQRREAFQKHICKPIQTRVLNVFKHWIDKYFYDFQDDPKLLEKFDQFLKIMVMAKAPEFGKQLKKRLDKAATAPDILSRNDVMNKSAPKPKLFNISSQTMTIYGVDEVEVARQLTLMTFEQYSIIQPKDLLDTKLGQSGDEAKRNAVNIMINTFNVFSDWVVTEIVQGETPKDRAARLSYWIGVSKELKALKNYDSMMAINAAMNKSSINRLAKSWEKVPPKDMRLFEEFSLLLHSNENYKSLRGALKSIAPPCIPFLGMYKTDLLFIETGNKDNIDGKINFDKRRKLSMVISDIQQTQQAKYDLHEVLVIQDFLRRIRRGKMSEDEAYNQSLKIEPRT